MGKGWGGNSKKEDLAVFHFLQYARLSRFGGTEDVWTVSIDDGDPTKAGTVAIFYYGGKKNLYAHLYKNGDEQTDVSWKWVSSSSSVPGSNYSGQVDPEQDTNTGTFPGRGVAIGQGVSITAKPINFPGCPDEVIGTKEAKVSYYYDPIYIATINNDPSCFCTTNGSYEALLNLYQCTDQKPKRVNNYIISVNEALSTIAGGSPTWSTQFSSLTYTFNNKCAVPKGGTPHEFKINFQEHDVEVDPSPEQISITPCLFLRNNATYSYYPKFQPFVAAGVTVTCSITNSSGSTSVYTFTPEDVYNIYVGGGIVTSYPITLNVTTKAIFDDLPDSDFLFGYSKGCNGTVTIEHSGENRRLYVYLGGVLVARFAICDNKNTPSPSD